MNRVFLFLYFYTTWSNTHVTAGERLTLQSGGDTNLRGAVASGTQVVADIGGNLNIESLQDTSTFNSKDRNVGGSVMVGAGFAASASYAKTKVDGDFASVREQSGIQAGDGGFDVTVKGNTDLKGAVIASSELAAREGVNTLTTGTLTTSNIENYSEYKATSVSLSGGVSMSGSDTAEESAQTAASNVAGKGSEWALQNFGNNASAGAPGHSKESGSDNSITQSGISAGVIHISDDVAQQMLTGKTADDMLASIDRDVLTGDSANGLTKNWDPDKLAAQVKAQAEIAAAFSQQAYSQVDRYVQSERAALQSKLKEANTPEEIAAIAGELRDLKLEERAMNILIGAVTGSGASAVTKETLSAAASEMRRLMIEDSMRFAGITDGTGEPLSNISGESVGVEGDGKKLGGTRLDLDIICGESNERCKMNPDGTLWRDENNMVRFDVKEAKMTLAQFLETDEGKKASGATGGIQGNIGTLFGMEYQAGSWVDKLVEAFAGTHDMIGGKWSGLYDEEGNATRGRSQVVAKAQEAWSIAAIVPSTPFAMSEALPPEVWQAIALFLQSGR